MAPSYQRGLKKRHISMIALGGIIGSSYFLGTGFIFRDCGPSLFLAYIFGGAITFLTMMCLSELSIATQAQGSFISYVYRYLSPAAACGIGWSYWISWAVYIPSECMAGGILMHNFFPEVAVSYWTILFGIAITLINLFSVKFFGEFEFWFALVKIILIIGFCILAVLIFLGLVGSREPIGLTYLWNNGGLFPNGVLIFFVNMVVLLSNFQGSEIIGLSALEAQDPRRSIISALKKISLRICGLYIVPTLLLSLIFPWQEANLGESVFSDALQRYGLIHYAKVFSFFIITGALSCANSGLYATARSLQALALRNMGPSYLQALNRHGVPAAATLTTLGAVWILLLAAYFFPAHHFYANLLAISGFTGTVCWISICLSQISFRKNLPPKTTLAYKIPFFPLIPYTSIALQGICLLLLIFSPTLRPSIYFGIPVLAVPTLLYLFFNRKK